MCIQPGAASRRRSTTPSLRICLCGRGLDAAKNGPWNCWPLLLVPTHLSEQSHSFWARGPLGLDCFYISTTLGHSQASPTPPWFLLFQNSALPLWLSWRGKASAPCAILVSTACHLYPHLPHPLPRLHLPPGRSWRGTSRLGRRCSVRATSHHCISLTPADVRPSPGSVHHHALPRTQTLPLLLCAAHRCALLPRRRRLMGTRPPCSASA